MESTHIQYHVPSGSGNTLLFEMQTPGPLRNLRFVVGGNQQALRIWRIREAINGLPDIGFTDATPHEVTLFFVHNPGIPSGCHRFHITIDNLSSTDEPLHVSALYEPTGEPCVFPL